MTGAPRTAPCVARYTAWPSLLEAKDGEAMETTWDSFFDALAEPPPPFSGDQKHGGWSPALFQPCHRARANVVSIHALVLDYDSGNSIDSACQLWGDFYGFLHTSRRHTAEHPRFRVILPFTRPVTPAEFAVVWGWANEVARAAGQELDQAPKDPSRFWYLPAAAPGAPYVAHRLDGDPIDPGPILDRPKPAPVPTSRPLPSDELERRAVAYLARMPGAVSGQRGHDALWAAALALVRGFGLPREAALRILRTEYNPRCTPPWSDKELEHKVSSAENDSTQPIGYLADVPNPRARPALSVVQGGGQPAPEPEPPAPAPDWRTRLRVKSDGITPQKSYGNTFEIVSNHTPWRGRFALNEMSSAVEFDRRPLAETMPDVIRRQIERDFGFSPGLEDVRRALGDVAALAPFHPVRDYLRGLQWDGQERLSLVAPLYLGTDDPLHATMVRKWFLSAVARGLSPGCKVDTALVLVGPQGWRKSSFFAALSRPWFSDSPMDVERPDGMLQLHSAWIHEWAELENVVSERRESRVKAFLASTTDTFRAPYARAPAAHPRSSVIVGSTNKEHFLTDVTGSRRFWVVPALREVAVDLLQDARDQLWAEAVAAFDGQEPWWLGADAEAARARQNAAYQVEDSWTDQILAWLESLPPGGELTTWRVLNDALKVDTPRQDRAAQMRVARSLRELGYEPVVTGDHDKRTRTWKARRS